MKKQILSLLLISSSIPLLGAAGSLSSLLTKAKDSGLLTKAKESVKKFVEKGQPILAEEAILYKKYLYNKYGPALVDQYILGKATLPETLPEPVAEELALYKKYLFDKYGQPLVDQYILGKEAIPLGEEDLPEPEPASEPVPAPQQPKPTTPGDLADENMEMK